MAISSAPINAVGGTVQQASAADAANVMGLGSRVRLTDEDYTIVPSDDLIVLTSTTSTGNYTLTFPTGDDALEFSDGKEIEVILPAALGGTDAYVSAGVQGSPHTFDAAGDHARFRYLKEEDQWHVLNNGIA